MTSTTSITLTDEQAAALAPLLAALVGVSVDGSAPADQTPTVSVSTGPNAAGRLVYLDGPLKGKYAPTLTDAERAEKAAAGEAYVAERKARRESKVSVTGENSNVVMAAWLRELGFVPNGTVWALAKAGERSKSVLAKAHKVDVAARAAAKAANA